MIKEFELITVVNEHNWIDCSSQHQENAHLAVCGELFDMSFDLLFIEFLPPTNTLKFWIQGECLDLSLYLPEADSNYSISQLLAKCAKLTNRDGSIKQTAEDDSKKWRNIAQPSARWIDCWSVPILALSITYTYYPVPPLLKHHYDLDVTTPEREEILLSPIRPSAAHSKPNQRTPSTEDFDPTTLLPDIIEVELEVGPSVLCLTGSLLRHILFLKENYLGESQQFHDFDLVIGLQQEKPEASTTEGDGEIYKKEFDTRNYRPFEVTVSITLHDIQGHLMKNCTKDEPPCPSLYLERLGFEMHKTYRETKLQLLLSPLVVIATDNVQRQESQQNLKDGHLAMAALQVRGHAMFSDVGRPLDSETLEYAWLVEVQVGDITGRLTLPQLYHIVMGIETFVLQFKHIDGDLQPPTPYHYCQHDLLQFQCPESTPSQPCLNPEDAKYRMTRLSVDAIEVCLVESGTALNLEIFPIRLATCNLHGGLTSSGLSALIQHICVRQYALISSLSGGSSSSSAASQSQTLHPDIWLEVGAVSLGPVFLDSIMSSSPEYMSCVQDTFLKIHDQKLKHLWFLWPPKEVVAPQSVEGKCGCVGGCAFFGKNRNGQIFFQTHKAHMDGSDTVFARFHILTNDDYGFGQSLLNKEEFVFDISDTSSGETSRSSPEPSDKCCMFFSGFRSQTTSKSHEGFSRRTAKDTISKTRSQHEDLPEVSKNALSTWIPSSLDSKRGKRGNVISMQPDGGAGQCPSRRFMRQFSSPTRSSLIKTSSFLSHGSPLFLSVPGSTSNNDTSDLPISRKGSSHSESEKHFLEDRDKGENSSSNITPHKHNSRISLNGWPSVQSAEDRKKRASSFTTRDRSPRVVKRAVSTDSAQSLDMFYSADEDSEASGTTDDTLAVDTPLIKKRHSTPSGNSVKLEKLEEKCSFHGEDVGSTREDSHTFSSSSTQHDSSDSHSVVSSSSFISAVSSQEDIALVNLHNQMDKPIVESPLLMSCYTAYMTQLKCFNWQEPPPLPHLTQQSGITEAGPNRHYLFLRSATRWKPKFTPLVKGFTAIHMIDKNRSGRYARNHSLNQQQNHFGTKEEKVFFPGSLHSKFERKTSKREEKDGKQEIHTSSTTMVVKLSGDISIMSSPLQAETFKNFVDAISPTLAGLHPLTVLNHLHAACSDHVEKLNQLKKEKVLYLGQLRAEAQKQATDKLQKESKNPKISLAASPSGSLGGNNYEETKVERLHIFMQVSEVNMSIMQASIVEEIISFSALDNLKDLTCVSLLAVRINNLFLQLYNSRTAQRKIQTFSDHTLESVLLPKPIDRSLKKARSVTLPVESLTLETSETQEVENIVLASIDSIHMQLRRLKNNSTILKDAVLTVIPSYMSKVSFTFERMTPTNEVENDEDKDEDSFDSDRGQSGEEEWMGFIMFECRLEDINVKCVKRVGFEPQAIEKKYENHQPNDKMNDEPGKSMKAGETSPSKDTSKSNPSSGSCDTRFSFPSCVSECGSSSSSSDSRKELNLPELIGDASSFIVELKSVLFNFAAPPRMPNTRKIDFTRLDWHLLSTATPSINSWLKPCDRLLISLRKLDRQRKQRACAIMGCLMAEALEMQSIHMPVKSKYLVTKTTPLAKTLQEDPSCQLVLVLKRYLSQVNLDEVEENLSPLHIPQLKALFHGLMALSRQWKNILYVPLLLEQNIRFRKSLRPMSVSFAFPPGERVNISTQDDVEKTSLEECEISDETTNLLVAEGGSIPRGFSSKNGVKAESSRADALKVFSSPESGTDSSSSQHDAVDPQDGGTVTKSGKKRLPSYVPRSSRASVAFPLLGGPLDSPARYAGNAPTVSRLGGLFMHPSHMKRNESHHSLKSATWSLSSMEPNFPTSTIDTPRRGMMEKEENFSDEDLYKWMARQQDYMRGGLSSYRYRYNDPNDQESKMNTLTSENSGDLDTSSLFPQVAFAPLGTQLADAHVIFQVLLDKLGVPIQAGSPSISKFVGPRASISGGISLLKIDIVESEYQNNARHKKKSPFSHSSASHGKFFIDTSMDTPAFICDRFSVEMDIKDVRDFEQGEKGPEQNGKVTALVFTQEGLPNTTCVINFNINVNYVAQQVNMPLLRLLHQFSTMYENIKETRSELHAIRPGSLKEKESPRGLQKKSSPSSDSQTETFHPHSPRGTSVSKPSTPTPTPTKSSAVGTSFSVGIKRPHSLSQRLRASTKGYTNLQELTVKDDRPSSPLSITPSESVAIDIPDSCSVPLSGPNLVTDIKELQPRCWRTMFYLLDLYNTMPETKTVTDR
ncbi:uncharacterized protein KIAA1109-like [Limulus polyphemus]|uniref:Uncharacterized protein KIAA1109-like n=1 Tax=Limulus polyphemus TaxID=6850 RepID=A0ABM1BU40_LIMPO|nr:uncharacterized protein KIAA1109-like [Limulus polyphemus]